MASNKLFYRFLKEENIYTIVIQILKHITLFYEGFADGINTSMDEVFFQAGLGNHYSLYKKWQQYSSSEIYQPPKYTNIPTKLFKQFINFYNIEKETIGILYGNSKISKLCIEDNTIDILLRKEGVTIYRFFSSTRTFCKWSDFEYVLTDKKLDWKYIHDEWQQFLSNSNIPNVLV